MAHVSCKMASKNICDHDKAVLNCIFNPSFPQNEQDESSESEENAGYCGEEEDVEESKRLEVEAVRAAEKGDLTTAVNQLNQALSLTPSRPSCFNNRAQALRLKGDLQGAIEDLENAIALSEGRGKVSCQAHIQRGLIRRLQGDDTGALEDFKEAAKLGSDFAKQMVISMNPYAAMCNQMLREVINKIRTGEDSG